MNRRQKIIVSVTGIFLVLLLLVGLTYAYFLTRIQGNEESKSISVTTANLRLVYNDGSDGVIGGTNIIPSDTVYTKTFTVKNEGNANTKYGVYLIDVINTFERKDDIKYTMTCSTDGEIECSGVSSETTFPSGITQLITNIIEPNKTHTYTFSFTYKDTGTDQSVDMNKQLQAKIQIYGENQNGVITPYEDDSLIFNILTNSTINKNGTTLVNTSPSIVAEEVNSISVSGYEEETSTVDLSSYYASIYDDINSLRNNINYQTFKTCTEDVVGKYLYDKTNETIFLIDECLVTDVSYEEAAGYYYDADAEVLSNTILSEDGDWSTLSYSATCTEDIVEKYIFNFSTNSSDYVKSCDGDKPVIEASLAVVKKAIYDYESVLSFASDDYGTSYYYRGDVKDNYVNFADMCWRIVRIQGDGSIKLILEDKNATCDSASFTGNFDLRGSTSSYGNYGYEGTSKDISGYTMHIASYLEPVTDSTQSMVRSFYNFQNKFTEEELRQLKPGDWCLGDITTAYDPDTGEKMTTSLSDLRYNRTRFRYDSYIRLRGIGGEPTPTFKCNGVSMDKFKNVSSGETVITTETDMYVGTLTADEVVYAGGHIAKENKNYYLISDYQKNNSFAWFSLTLMDSYGSDAVFSIQKNGRVINTNYVDNYYGIGFRPSVVLISGISISQGEGTKTKPYVVG